MGSLFSDNNRFGAAPPPRAAASYLDEDPAPRPPPPKKPSSLKFDAELDLCELDDRDRPGATWSGKGRELSRSNLVFRSRRMCHCGRRILVAVHLIDDKPVPLFGKVTSCEYDGDGLYRVEMELLKTPERTEVTEWIAKRGRN